MAKASADCIGEAHGGFASDGSDISGFSHMVHAPPNLVMFVSKLTLLINLSTTPGLAA